MLTLSPNSHLAKLPADGDGRRGYVYGVASLAILKNAGIVEDERRGAQVYYRLRVECVLNLFECVESVMECNVRNNQKMLAR